MEEPSTPWTRCISTLGCPEASLEEAIQLAAEHDVAALELRALGGTIELPAYWHSRGETPANVAQTVRQSGVPVAMLDTSMRLIGAPADAREKLLEFVPWAEALGVRYLRAFDGGKRLGEGEIAEACSTLGWWREQRQRHGWRVDLAVETHDTLFSAAEIQRLMAHTGPFPLLWDTHHTWKRGGEQLAVTWAGIHAHVVHLHVKDSVSLANAKHPFTYVRPGDGEFPQAELRSLLRDHPYRGTMSLEWERLWHPELEPLATVLRAARDANWW